MSKAYVPEEVEVLRFFEEAPIEKAELHFNIVKEKMRGRLAPNGGSEKPKKKRHSAVKEMGEPALVEESATSSPQV
jgi:hypothetical protein